MDSNQQNNIHFIEDFLQSATFEFRRYKTYGDKTFEQLSENELLWCPSETDLSIALIVKHLSGNMKSRWSHFLTQDGEKSWRNREEEFKNPPENKKELIKLWENGWKVLFEALDNITPANFDTAITIRSQRLTILEAINRQLAHYASHVGQIIYLGKMMKKKDWISPSIPKGQSKAFNEKMFRKNS